MSNHSIIVALVAADLVFDTKSGSVGTSNAATNYCSRGGHPMKGRGTGGSLTWG